MPPILRHTTATIEAPADLPAAARFALDLWLDSGEDYIADCPEWEQALFASLPPMEPVDGDQAEMHEYDGAVLTDIRNLCDLLTLRGAEDCHDWALGYRLEPPPPNVSCGECEHCRLLLLRDRIDHWFDRAGVRKNAYIGDVGPEVEDAWRRCYAGDTWWQRREQEQAGSAAPAIPSTA